MKHLKLFEQFEDDPFGEEIIPGRIRIGDRVSMREPINAYWNTDRFSNSAYKCGDKMGRVIKTKVIKGVECVFPDDSYAFYKSDNLDVIN